MQDYVKFIYRNFNTIYAKVKTNNLLTDIYLKKCK